MPAIKADILHKGLHNFLRWPRVSPCWVSQLEKHLYVFPPLVFLLARWPKKLLSNFDEFFCRSDVRDKDRFLWWFGSRCGSRILWGFYHDGIGATVQNLLIRSFCRRILTKGLWGVVICLAPSATFDFLVTVRLQDFNGILSLRDRGGYLWSLEFSIFGKNEAKRFSYREWSCPGSTASESPPLICLSVRCRTSSPAGWCSLL